MRDHGGFEGNGQTLRIATKLEHFSDNHGYNFTRRVILGILKYPVPYKSVVNPDITPSMKPGASAIDIIDRKKSKPPKCYFDCEQEVVDWVLSSVSFEDRTLFQNTLIVEGKHKRTLHKSLDASIMDTADDIAYGIHDLEDSIALRLISEKEFRLRIDDKICSPLLEFLASKGESVDTYNNMVKSLFGSGKERKRCISRLVGVMINSTRFTTCEVLKDPIVRYGVGLSEEHRAFLDRLQEIVEEFVILSPNVQHLEFKGQTMVVSVFEALASDPKSLLPRDAYESFVKSSEPNRVICDFVAGMTDRYLLKTFERLFSPRMGSVFDKL
jgi:dGTPase